MGHHPQQSEPTPQIHSQQLKHLQEETLVAQDSVWEESPGQPTEDSPCFLHPIQAKLMIGQADDPHELEADDIAKDVISRIHRFDTPPSPADGTDKFDSPVEVSPLSHTPNITPLQKREDAGHPSIHNPLNNPSSQIEAAIERSRGQGRSLPNEFSTALEEAFGTSLNHVRIHTDHHADWLTHQLHAQAFATGNDIFFRGGAYQPGNDSGKELLTHEVTHTIQQRGHNTGTTLPIQRTLHGASDALKSAGGTPSRSAKFKGAVSLGFAKSTYTRILGALETYESEELRVKGGGQPRDLEFYVAQLTQILKLIGEWEKNNRNKETGEFSDADLSRASALLSLRNKVNAELRAFQPQLPDDVFKAAYEEMRKLVTFGPGSVFEQVKAKNSEYAGKSFEEVWFLEKGRSTIQAEAEAMYASESVNFLDAVDRWKLGGSSIPLAQEIYQRFIAETSRETINISDSSLIETKGVLLDERYTDSGLMDAWVGDLRRPPKKIPLKVKSRYLKARQRPVVSSQAKEGATALDSTENETHEPIYASIYGKKNAPKPRRRKRTVYKEIDFAKTEQYASQHTPDSPVLLSSGDFQRQQLQREVQQVEIDIGYIEDRLKDYQEQLRIYTSQGAGVSTGKTFLDSERKPISEGMFLQQQIEFFNAEFRAAIRHKIGLIEQLNPAEESDSDDD